MTQMKSGTKEEKKEVCVLIRVKPKYTEEFCIMMLACKELCKRVSKFKKLAKIDEAFSVLGPFDFLLELSQKKYLFSLKKNSPEVKQLNEFLQEDFDANVKGQSPKWTNNNNKINFNDGKNTISLEDKNNNVTLRINDDDERTYELVKKVGEDGWTDIYWKEKEVNERINRTIFKIRETLGSYIYETHTLTKFELSEFLKGECKKSYSYLEKKSKEVTNTAELAYIWNNDKFKKCLEEETLKRLSGLQNRLKQNAGQQEIEAEKKYLFSWDNIPGNDNVRLIDFLKQNYGINLVEIAKIEKSDDDKTIILPTDKNSLYLKLNDEITNVSLKIDDDMIDEFIAKMENDKLKIYKKKKKHVHILIKVKPDCTEKFFLAMTIFKSLCNDPTSQYLAKIRNKTCSIIGPFDFLLELIAEGAEEEERTEKINRTIFEIRETLGSYIYETHTIEKFQIPITKEDLESFFKKKLRVKNLVRLPHCEGEKVPHERHKPNDKINLKEIYCTETTALKKLLEKAKTFLELEDLDEQIIDLNSRVEELEKR